MKSSNDIYHGDEHLVEGKSKWVITATEVVEYEVEVEAESEDEAMDLAMQELCESPDLCEVNRHGFETTSIKELPRLNIMEDY